MIAKLYIKGIKTLFIKTFFSFVFLFSFSVNSFATKLSDIGLYVLPYPQEVSIRGDAFVFTSNLTIVLNKNHSAADEFAANELVNDLKEQWNITARISTQIGSNSIVFIRSNAGPEYHQQGYQITTSKNEIIIKGNDEDGLFYGTRTLLQLIQKKGESYQVLGLKITDWPSVLIRAVHYDTKHHQDKMSYVKSFIKELANYKINMLVWEWEDKFAYPSHPVIGAPGAFTLAEMRDITAYARKYHIQIVPLVQGLGHVSFILKWPQFAHLREIPASNFEFCPLKEGTYNLLFDLWKDAIEATPGSKYIHIGSDETYELGLCEQCRKKADSIGKEGLYQLFSNKVAKFIESQGRIPMIWETPMGWETGDNLTAASPDKNLVLTEDDDNREQMIAHACEAKKLGYKVFFYDPNPGIEPLFLPYMFKEGPNGSREMGCLEDSYNALTKATASGVYDGVICTSWDDAGLHNQMWMMRFITAATFSWNANAPSLSDFKYSYFKNYYGSHAENMEELFSLLNGGSYYYWNTFERKVWHFGEIGKTYMPDLPRGDAVEFDPYWNAQHKDMIEKSRLELKKMDRAMAIIQQNKKAGVKHPYDFDVFESIVALIRHTCMAYEDLSRAEQEIQAANRLTFINRDSTYNHLERACQIVESCIMDRKKVFYNLVTTWQKTRLPKGMSVGGKKYFFQQDRTRHFANRRPDMTYLIYDEQKLGMEKWVEQLKIYMKKYKNNSFQQ